MPESSKSNAAPLRASASGFTQMGPGRLHNDDVVLLRPELSLYAVADGAGSGGNVASAVAIASVANFFEATERTFSMKPDVDGFGFSSGARRLASAVQKANRDIAELAAGSKQHRKMGATIVAMSFSPGIAHAHVASVGDSRCYRLRAGLLEQLTEDHSLIHDAVALRPDIEDEELARLPRNVVTRTLGTRDGMRVFAKTITVVDGDKYLLCSDGLSDVLGDDAIRAVLVSARPPADLVAKIVKAAADEGGEDNIAAIVVSCEVASHAAVALRRAPPITPTVRADRHTELASEDYMLDVDTDDDPTLSRQSATPPHDERGSKPSEKPMNRTLAMPGRPATRDSAPAPAPIPPRRSPRG